MIRYKKKNIEKRTKEENEKWTDNHIRDEGAKAINEAMKINTTLTSLDLKGDDKIWKKKRKY